MKSAYQSAHVKAVTAWALLFDGKHAGNIVSVRGETSQVTATISAWLGPLGEQSDKQKMTGRTNGQGFDKISAAIDKALGDGHPDLHGIGENAVISYLESLGYKVIVVIPS